LNNNPLGMHLPHHEKQRCCDDGKNRALIKFGSSPKSVIAVEAL
jgi:hypothetical protein